MNTNENESAAHCKIGPSTLPARAVCPCHESAPGCADAQSGTRSHKVVEASIHGEIDGGESVAAQYSPDTTEDEIGRGVWGANTIKRLRDETAPGAYIHTETRVEYSENTRDLQEIRAAFRGKFGTVDAFWESADGETVYVADYKTYANSDSEKSYLPQGMMYAVLLESRRKPYKRATFFVVAGGDRTVARYDFELPEAKAVCAAIIRRVGAIRGGDIFATGEEARTKCGKPSAWCKTCAHAATCPAISRAVAIVSEGGILQKPLAVRMAVVPVLESFVKSVKAEVKATLDAGERVFDAASGIEYGYAERRGRAKLADLRGLAEAAIGYGVKPDDFAAAVSVSKTAVDGLLKAVDEANGRKVKKADREAVYVRYFTEPGMEKYVKRISEKPERRTSDISENVKEQIKAHMRRPRPEIRGKVIEILPEWSNNSGTFFKRDVVIETGFSKSNPIKVTFTNEGVDFLEGLETGDEVIIPYALDGRKWDGPNGTKYFLEARGLDLMRKEATAGSGAAAKPVIACSLETAMKTWQKYHGEYDKAGFVELCKSLKPGKASKAYTIGDWADVVNAIEEAQKPKEQAKTESESQDPDDLPF